MITNQNKYFIVAGIAISLILVSYLSYNIGLKDLKESHFTPKVNLVLDNGNQENSLTKIQIRDIIGSSDAKNKQSFGKFYFVNKTDLKTDKATTDILFKLDNIPLKVINEESKTEKEVPLELNIDLAIKTADGLQFNYENIGRIKLAVNDKKQLKGDFNGVLNFGLDDKKDKIIQRIILRPTNPDQANIYQDTDPNLPIKVRGDKGRGITGEPAPYFWVDI
jgi:hypothetical protein